MRKYGRWIALAVLASLLVSGSLFFQNNIRTAANQYQANQSALTKLLAFDKPRRYLVAFQNLAEARGTGGILGAYAEVEVSRGHLTVLKTGSDLGLVSNQTIPVSMPSDFTDLYGQDPAIWQNSNLSPDFADASKIWIGLWKDQFRERLDGVISVDSVTVKSLLEAIGPVTMPTGLVINSKNVVEETLSASYQQFEGDNLARKDFLVAMMNQVFNRVSSIGMKKKAEALLKIATANQFAHLMFYSTDPKLEKFVAETSVGQRMSSSTNNEYRAVIVNTDGSKLDYYTRVKVKLNPVACDAGSFSQIRVTVTNGFDAARRLPDYVWGRLDKGKPGGLGGAHALKLYIFGPSFSDVESVERTRFDLGVGNLTRFKNRALVVLGLDLKPAQSETVTATFSGGDGLLSYVDQPSVVSQKVLLSQSCE